ncbi:MAG: transcription antitermination factor NusB [Bacteroidales bacterium]
MINRVLIRMKVMQLIYSFYQKEDRSLAAAEKELMFSLEKSYELYHFMLLLMVELTELQERKLDSARNKYLPSASDKNPSLRFIDNQFIKQLKSNLDFQKYCNNQKISWTNESEFLKQMLDKVLTSELYQSYIAETEVSYAADREFWRSTFKNLILEDEYLSEVLESISLYWNDDLDVIGTFVLKSIKQFKPESGENQALLPMFKASDDRDFAFTLFCQSILKEKEYRELIDAHTKNWEMERIAFMDIVIMQTAVAELLNFPSIPVNVTLNEYIELAKAYSTPKSGVFVNGVLDSIINQLKSEKKILKN